MEFFHCIILAAYTFSFLHYKRKICVAFTTQASYLGRLFHLGGNEVPKHYKHRARFCFSYLSMILRGMIEIICSEISLCQHIAQVKNGILLKLRI